MRLCIGIPTRNRPFHVDRLLLSISNLRSVENLKIIVCDSSDLEFKNELLINILKYKSLDLNILNSQPGLTIQRNIILNYARSNKYDYLFFLDDDVSLSEDYIEKILIKFEEYKQIKIIGARISNLAKPKFPVFFQGRVRKNGTCIGIYSLEKDSFVDWIPGLNMVLKISAIQEDHFDETRLFQSIGEDADFTLKYGLNREVLWTPTTSVLHHHALENRLNASEYLINSNNHRYKLMQTYPNYVKRINIVLYDFYCIIMDLCRFIYYREFLHLNLAKFRVKYLKQSRFYSRIIDIF